jgi:ankyrin repeat protein
MSRFPHLMEQIICKLDEKGLVKCREVSRTLQEFVDIKEYPWLRIVKIPTRLEKGDTYLDLAAEYGQFGMFEWILDSETDKKVLYEKSSSSFLHACYFGHVVIAEMLLNKLDELRYDLMRIGILINDTLLMTKSMYVESGFKHGCRNGNVNIVEMLLDKSENEKNNPLTKWNPTKSLRFNFTTKNNFGQTGFHLACGTGHSKVVELLINRSESLNFDLTAKNVSGHTGFHLGPLHVL